MSDDLEISTPEGLLCWDGRILESFGGDGRRHSWRLHAALIAAIDVERRQDLLCGRVRIA